MSYSFIVKGATVALALAAASEAFAKVVESQPIHAADQAPALGTASVFADLLATDDTKDVQISMNGYLSWNHPEGQEPAFCGSSVTVSVNHVNRISV